MLTEQSYAPWRQCLLSRAELAALSRPNFALSAAHAAWLWLQILLLWWAAWGALHHDIPHAWVAVAVCAALVGNRYYALYILGHDGLHRRLHTNLRINDLFNDLVCIGPIGAVTHRNRSNHMTHHRRFATEADPDAYKYASRHRLGRAEFLLSLTALPFVWRAVSNVYQGRTDRRGHKATANKLNPLGLRDLCLILGWQIVLMVGLTIVFGWWGYLCMWLLPIYLFTFAADMLRVHCEHAVRDEQSLAALPEAQRWVPRCTSFLAGPVECALFAPMNMNHHAAHHLWPSIPWHNLPKATQLLQARVGSGPQVGDAPLPFHTIHKSYLGWLCQLRA